MRLFSEEQINDLLVTALEGGSNYWYMIEDQSDPDIHPADLISKEDSEGWIKFSCTEDEVVNGQKEWIIKHNDLRRAEKIMYKNYPHHFGDVLKEQSDAITADVFLQCALFGEVVFG